jgi:hypothetical protein
LKEHKDLVNNLLQVINSKREQMYLLESKIEVLEKEKTTWMYDIDNIKKDKNIFVISTILIFIEKTKRVKRWANEKKYLR